MAQAKKSLSKNKNAPTDLSDVRFADVQLLQVNTGGGGKELKYCKVVFFNSITNSTKEVPFSRPDDAIQNNIIVPVERLIDLTMLDKCFVKDISGNLDEGDGIYLLLGQD